MIRSIEFFLFPDAVGLDVTGPLEVFSAASELLRRKGQGKKGYRPVFSAENAGIVRLSSGLSLQADAALGEGDPPDIFLVPGGPGVEGVTQSEGLLGRIRSAAERAEQIVSVCNGALILAACGLLEGRRATTHWMAAEALARRYPAVTVEPDAIFLIDGHIATSAGVTAGIDLALAMVEEDHGSALAMEVARILVLYLRRSGGQSQFSAPMEARRRAGKRFSALHDWILTHLQRPLSVEDLAEAAGMSPRNFSRVFASETGIPPARYLEEVRVERARELLESGDDTIGAVAETCGFGREGRLRRAFLRRLSITPVQYRIHFGKAGP